MATYFSTFIVGFEQLIDKTLANFIPDVQIVTLSDGFIVYQTSATVESIASLGFFNNSYILLSSFEDIRSSKDIQRCLTVISKDQSLLAAVHEILPNRKLSFRVVVSQENQMVANMGNFVQLVERNLLQIHSLIVHKSRPDVEFWLYIRREGMAYFGIRLTTHTSYDKVLEKGELRPELCQLLVLLSRPKPTDIFLDPCCGSGAIPIQRAKMSAYKSILAGDRDPEMLKIVRSKLRDEEVRITVGRWDVQDLHSFQDASVSTIVTDPPWGIHSGKHLQLETFYTRMLAECSRILQIEGMLVILLARSDLFDKILKQNSKGMKVIKRYKVLVSGQKATVYQMVKEQ